MQIDPERSSALADMYAGRTMLKSKVLHVSESAFLEDYKYKMCCALETLRILAPENPFPFSPALSALSSGNELEKSKIVLQTACLYL